MTATEHSTEAALNKWKEGMEKGDRTCAFNYCAYFVDNNKADDRIVEILEELVRDEETPCEDACALLHRYYARIGDDELAAEWLECGLDMGSEMCLDIVADEREEEGDDW